MILHFLVFPCLSIAPLVSIINSHKTSSNQFQLSRTLSIVKQIFFNFKCSQGQYLYFLSQIQKWTIQNDHQVHHIRYTLSMLLLPFWSMIKIIIFSSSFIIYFTYTAYILHTKIIITKYVFFSHMMTFIPTFTLP